MVGRTPGFIAEHLVEGAVEALGISGGEQPVDYRLELPPGSGIVLCTRWRH